MAWVEYRVNGLGRFQGILFMSVNTFKVSKFSAYYYSSLSVVVKEQFHVMNILVIKHVHTQHKLWAVFSSSIFNSHV